MKKALKNLNLLFSLTSLILGSNLLILFPVLAQTNFPLVSDLEAGRISANQNSQPQVKRPNKRLYISQPPALDEIYNVHQLKDVTPKDWAYEALRNLVERYRCISGFPDASFRGNRTMSRYEFAAALNTCLLKINRLVDNFNTVSGKQDVAVMQRLQEEFATEIQIVTGKVDNLEERVAFTEDHQFSPTVILRGSADFNLTGAFGENKAVLPGNNPREREKLSTNLTLSARSILNLDTSFTGKDKLRVKLQAGDVNNFGRPITGTDMTLLAGSTSTNKNIKLSTLFYQFPLGNSAIAAIAPAADFPTRVFPALNPVFSISNFGSESPIYSFAFGSGAVIYYNVTDELAAGVSYLTSTGDNPSQGIFNGQYTILTQVTYTPSEKIGIAFTYGHYYAPEPISTVDVTGSKGSQFGEFPFGAITPTSSNDFGLQFTYKFTDQLTLGGWISYFNAVAEGSPTVSGINGFQGSHADIWSWAVTASLVDLGKLGSQLSFILGMPPKVTNNNISERQDQNTALHIELSYRYPINDNIYITPGFLLIINPEHNSANSAIGIGLVRTTFTF